MIKVAILGAGPAGLIAARELSLQIEDVSIALIDRRTLDGLETPEVPHPFFMHSDIGNELGVRLEPVRVMEAILSHRLPCDWPNLWSLNTINRITPNLMWRLGDRAIQESNWWMADNLLSSLLRGMSITIDLIHSEEITSIDLSSKTIFTKESFLAYDAVVNTLPIPIFCKMAEIDAPGKHEVGPCKIFFWDKTDNEGFNRVSQIFYSPEALYTWTRFGNVFGQITCEFSWDESSGFKSMGKLKYPHGYEKKIGPPDKVYTPDIRFIPEDDAPIKRWIYDMTDQYKVWNIGRYATWSYKRVDHLPQDAREIAAHIAKELA